MSDIKRYFLQSLPRAIRQYRFYIMLATALFFLGAFFAAGYVAADPGRFYQLMPEGVTVGEGGARNWDYALMSAVIMTNNISVAVTAFGLGILGGAGTVYVLVYNGLIVGGVYGFLSASGGDKLAFFSLILPHGVLELFAIFLAGACGLMLGKGLLMPGDFTRRQALVFQAKRAIKLIPGIVVALTAAGLIEGFFTPLAIAPGWKLAFAGMTAVGIAAYVAQAPHAARG